MIQNLKVLKSDMPEKVIVCGDPARALSIAEKLENHKQIGKNREYHSYSGQWNGETIAIVSHGVGSPGAAVCFEELAMAGVKLIIRVGTAGSYPKEIEPGSLVISTGAARRDGLSNQIVPEGFPAIADRHIVTELANAANTYSNVYEGITLTLDAFYGGSVAFPHNLFKQSNVMAVEMENAALFTIAALRKFKAGAILAIDGYADADFTVEYNPHTDVVRNAVDNAAVIALNALVAAII